jgi:hypothetical protein
MFTTLPVGDRLTLCVRSGSNYHTVSDYNGAMFMTLPVGDRWTLSVRSGSNYHTVSDYTGTESQVENGAAT